MKIAYISADFGVHVFGYKGASIHVREMVAAFRRAGNSVHVLSPAMIDEKVAAQKEAMQGGLANLPEYQKFMRSFETAAPGAGVELCFEHVPAEPAHLQLLAELKKYDQFMDSKTRIRQEVRNQLYNLTLYDFALNYFREHPVDFVYERYALFAYAGIRLARELGVPHVLEVNAPLAYEQKKNRGMEMVDLANRMEQRIFRDTDKVLVVSEQLRDYVAACEVPAERIEVLLNAVDPKRFDTGIDTAAVRRKLDLNGKKVIGFVGSLKPWHGTETLLQAFKELPDAVRDCHLLIVGDGPRRQELEAFVQEHGLSDSVTFTGKVQHDAIPEYIAAMDITVAPYTPSENFYFSPIKIFEYMAMGKPVVGGNIGQVPELIQHGETGLLFEPGDASQLTEALQTLVQDANLCQRMGQTAERWVKTERTWDNNAQKVVQIARDLMR